MNTKLIVTRWQHNPAPTVAPVPFDHSIAALLKWLCGALADVYIPQILPPEFFCSYRDLAFHQAASKVALYQQVLGSDH